MLSTLKPDKEGNIAILDESGSVKMLFVMNEGELEVNLFFYEAVNLCGAELDLVREAMQLHEQMSEAAKEGKPTEAHEQTKQQVLDTVRSEVYVGTNKLSALMYMNTNRLKHYLEELQLEGLVVYDSDDDIWSVKDCDE